MKRKSHLYNVTVLVTAPVYPRSMEMTYMPVGQRYQSPKMKTGGWL